jgi:hypothetical protein
MSYYGTVNDADDFFGQHLNTSAWFDTSPADRAKALLGATELIDRLNYAGSKTLADQGQQFPRDGDTDVPTPILQACYWIALRLVEGIDTETEADLTNVVQDTWVATTKYDRSFMPRRLAAGIPSDKAWQLLYSYLRDPGNVQLVRGN